MKSLNNTHKIESTLPKQFIWAVVAICVLPFLLNLFGVDFGSKETPFPWTEASRMSANEKIEAIFHSFKGAFTHSLLEWSAFCTAIFTVILAFAHFRIKQDVVTPIIGIALFWAGCMDSFHTLAADRLIEATADNRNLIPFTWAICRTFNALILIVGAGILLLRQARQERHASVVFVSIISLVFGITAYGIIHFCARSRYLPETMYPSALVTRPWDVISLVLFIFAGTVVYPLFHRRHRSQFSLALWVSAIPEVATQFHMAFGSTVLFDNHFNIAHFLKIVAYIVPFSGLSLDYIRTYQNQKFVLARLEQTKSNLVETLEQVDLTNKELEREIIERKRAEQALQKIHQELETVVEERTAELSHAVKKINRYLLVSLWPCYHF